MNDLESTYTVARHFYPVDTSSIPNSDTISSATFTVETNMAGEGDRVVGLILTTQTSGTSLASGDFDNLTLNSPAEGATRRTVNSTGDHTFTLNATGLGWIDKAGFTKLGLRMGQDIDNTTPTARNYTWFYNADQTGTTQDPVLVVEHSGSGSPSVNGNIQNIAYTYDKVGNITQITDNSDTGAGKAITFSYDDLNRLTFASTTAASSTPFKHSFAYSSIGNITAMATSTGTGTTTYSYAETNYANPHAATSIGGLSMVYDNNGNLTSVTNKGYTWDYRNRLTAAGRTGSATTTFAYDHTVSRVKKIVTGGATTYYPNDLYNFTTSTTTKHILDAAGGLIATIEGNGTATSTSYHHTDHLGGGNVSTDATGEVIETTDYYPFGEQRIATGSFEEQRKFIGEEYDTETNLSYLNARYYEGSRGQFTSQDPVFWEIGQSSDGKSVLQNPQAQNSYSYAQNNPLVNKDPTGRFSIGIGWGGNVEGGFGAYTANYASTNVNLVVDPSSRQAWVVWSNSGATNSGYLDNYQSAPDNGEQPFTVGMYAGGGRSFSFSPKTTNPNDMNGTQNSTNLNFPFVSFSAQGAETGKTTYTVSAGPKSLASFSTYPVHTYNTQVVSVNQTVSKVTNQASQAYQSALSSIQKQINVIQGKINQLKARLSR